MVSRYLHWVAESQLFSRDKSQIVDMIMEAQATLPYLQ